MKKITLAINNHGTKEITLPQEFCGKCGCELKPHIHFIDSPYHFVIKKVCSCGTLSDTEKTK